MRPVDTVLAHPHPSNQWLELDPSGVGERSEDVGLEMRTFSWLASPTREFGICKHSRCGVVLLRCTYCPRTH